MLTGWGVLLGSLEGDASGDDGEVDDALLSAKDNDTDDSMEEDMDDVDDDDSESASEQMHDGDEDDQGEDDEAGAAVDDGQMDIFQHLQGGAAEERSLNAEYDAQQVVDVNGEILIPVKYCRPILTCCLPQEADETMQAALSERRAADLLKGQAVAAQQRLCKSLVEHRILLQQVLESSNRVIKVGASSATGTSVMLNLTQPAYLCPPAARSHAAGHGEH